ncbi:MAG: hypothetical protein IH597_04080 [Bacteroidales bacterium]|nr:hypothetical protein [Bacteroidales bacterium]
MRKKIEEILENKCFVFVLLLLLLAVFAVIASISQGSHGGGDDWHHHRISRYAFQYPHYFLDHWGKPIFTLLSSPFSQYGQLGTKLYNVICGILAAFFAYKLARGRDLQNPLLMVFFVLFAPIYAALMPSSMTEITGSLILVLAVYLYFRDLPLWSAIVISFIPFARTEGLLILPLFLIAFMLRRQWRHIPWLITATIIYSLVGWFHFKDLFWVFTKIPYHSGSFSIYGSGSILYYINRTKFIWGLPLAFLMIPGIGVHFYDLIRSRFSLKEKHIDEFLLIFLPLAGILAFHSLAWYLGTGALALDRFMVLTIPLAAFFALKGYNLIERLLSFRNFWLQLVLKFVVVYFIVITPFNIYRFPVPLGESDMVLRDAMAWIKNQGLDSNKIYYFHPSIFLFVDIDPHDRQLIQEFIPDNENPGNKMEPGSLLIWDAHYSANEGRLPVERVIESGNFEQLMVFRPKNPFKVIGNRDFEIYVFQKKPD